MENSNSIEREIKYFAHNIKWLRKQYGFSRKKMASILKIGVWSLNKIENGEMPPRLSARILISIKDSFGIFPSVLFTQWLEN